ncbi:MAG: phosphoenolpyruvate carboxykinase (ATP) [Collinsella sp.]
MHCSASMDPESRDTAVFFGLSGTRQDHPLRRPKRLLIGDDEHGWAMGEGIFNLEGGCCAKCDGLTEEREPEIFRAVKFGALCENVILNEHREPDYADVSLTQNTRVGYPVEHIPNSCLEGAGGEPTAVIFLTCDAFGVLPPISRLSADAAMYHFVSGFTSKVARHRAGHQGARPHLLGPVRRTVHAARPHGLRRHAR